MLTPNDPPKVTTVDGAGPRHITFHPDKPWMYVVNETNSSVSVFAFDADSGTIRPIQHISTLPDGYTDKSYCADIHITPDARFLYATNRGHDSMAGFVVDSSTGKITSIGQFPTAPWPREFHIDPAGTFLYTAGQKSDQLIMYHIDEATGYLERIKAYTVGQGPVWVEIVELEENKDQ